MPLPPPPNSLCVYVRAHTRENLLLGIAGRARKRGLGGMDRRYQASHGVASKSPEGQA